MNDFLGNAITHGATVVHAANHAAAETLRKGTVIAVSPRLLVRTTAGEKAWTAWIRDPLRVVVVR